MTSTMYPIKITRCNEVLFRTGDGVWIKAGSIRKPDPSGSPQSRTPQWIFVAWDGKAEQALRRYHLRDRMIWAAKRHLKQKEEVDG